MKLLLANRKHVQVDLPRNLQPKYEYVFPKSVLNYAIGDTYATVYNTVSVDGHGLMTSRHLGNKRSFLPGSVSPNQDTESSYWKMRMLYHRLIPTFKRIPKAIFLTDYCSHGYFHWITDVLSKIAFIPSDWQESPILLPKLSCASYVDATLTVFFEGLKVQVVSHYSKILVNEFLSIPLMCGVSGWFSPDIIGIVQKKALQYVAKHPTFHERIQTRYGTTPSRIFLSRKDAGYRYLMNEDALLPLLQEYGFTIVKASEHTFWEQVALCSSANVIMGMHGAALTNMVWMKNKGHVIEIRRKGDIHNNCYFTLTGVLGHTYYYIMADTDTEETKNANFTADVKDLAVLLKQFF